MITQDISVLQLRRFVTLVCECRVYLTYYSLKVSRWYSVATIGLQDTI